MAAVSEVQVPLWVLSPGGWAGLVWLSEDLWLGRGSLSGPVCLSVCRYCVQLQNSHGRFCSQALVVLKV